MRTTFIEADSSQTSADFGRPDAAEKHPNFNSRKWNHHYTPPQKARSPINKHTHGEAPSNPKCMDLGNLDMTEGPPQQLCKELDMKEGPHEKEGSALVEILQSTQTHGRDCVHARGRLLCSFMMLATHPVT